MKDGSTGKTKYRRGRLSALLLGSVVLTGVTTTTTAAQVAPAQEVPAESQAKAATPVGDTIVTATKREERLHGAPVAITAVGSERLQYGNIENLEDLQVVVPNISFGNDFNVAKIFIRGVGTNTSTNGSDSAVALYVDGAVIRAHEIGFKSQLLDNRIIFNVAAFTNTLLGCRSHNL